MGSPIPMNTMFLGAIPTMCRAAYHCPTISEAVNDRTSPICAVSQNVHPIAHPTWLDTHSVYVLAPDDPIIGISTDSISSVLPLIGGAVVPAAGTRCRNLTTSPSGDCSRNVALIGATVATAGNAEI